MLTAHRDAEAAKRFLRKAMTAAHNQEPRVITVDKNAAYRKAIKELKARKELSKKVKLRQNKVSQQHSRTRPSRDKKISETGNGIWLV